MMFEQFEAHLRGLRRADVTVEKYLQAARAFTGYLALRKFTLQTAPRTALEDFVTWLGTPPDDVGPATVQLMAYGCSTYLEYLRRRVEGIPEFYKPTLPKLIQRIPTVLQGPQIASYVMLANGQAEPYRTALILLPFCGLRIGELCSLQIGSLTYHLYGPGDKRYVITVIGKGNKQRMAPVFTGTRGSVSSLIDSYLDRVRPQLTHEPHNPYSDRYLFPGVNRRDGASPIKGEVAEHMVAAYRARLGVPNLTPHKLRSTYLTALLSIGIDISEAARYAGHSSIETIHKSYAGIRIENAQDCMGLLHRPFAKSEVRNEDRQRQQG